LVYAAGSTAAECEEEIVQAIAGSRNVNVTWSVNNGQSRCKCTIRIVIEQLHLRYSLFMDRLTLKFWGAEKTRIFVRAEMQRARIAHET
jgi:hypothetical protein